MSKKAKSFEEFYSKNKDDILDIDIVADYAESHDGDTTPFDKDMFCPECKQAELSFVHKTSKRRAHLRRIKSSNHKDGCSYNYEYASKKTVKKYVDSLNYEEIQDKLNSIMNMLCRKHNSQQSTHHHNEHLTKKRKNPMLIPERKDCETVLRALQRKRLNGWIDESDGEDFCVFYGKVKLKVIEKEMHTKLFMVLDSPKGKELDDDNSKLIDKIISDELEENQVLIASIYEFTSEKKITLENRAIEGRNK